MTPQYIIKAFALHILAIYICLSDMITLSKIDKNHRHSVIELIWNKKSR